LVLLFNFEVALKKYQKKVVAKKEKKKNKQQQKKGLCVCFLFVSGAL
jgi:hypothetical protein